MLSATSCATSQWLKLLPRSDPAEKSLEWRKEDEIEVARTPWTMKPCYSLYQICVALCWLFRQPLQHLTWEHSLCLLACALFGLELNVNAALATLGAQQQWDLHRKQNWSTKTRTPTIVAVLFSEPAGLASGFGSTISDKAHVFNWNYWVEEKIGCEAAWRIV